MGSSDSDNFPPGNNGGKDKLIQYLINKGINIAKQGNQFEQRRSSMFKVGKGDDKENVSDK